jgi:dipeptidyl-peptidase 4
MTKFRILAIALFLLSTVSKSQQNITLEECIMENRSRLAPENLKDLQWVAGAAKYSYSELNNEEYFLQIIDVKSSEKKSISLAILNTALEKSSIEKMGAIPSITWLGKDDFLFRHQLKFIKYNLPTNTMVWLNNNYENSENGDYEAQTNCYAYTIDNNLHFLNGKKEHLAITNFTDKNIVSGQSIHRQEFGIEKGTFWSPSGSLLAFYQMDQTDVTDYMLLDYTSVPATANPIKYPMAGQKSHYASVGVFNKKALSTVYLKTSGEKDHYLTNLAWSLDEKTVYLAEVNREQNTMQLNTYDATTGNFIKTLFEEKDSKYIEPEKPVFITSQLPNKFIWNSERDGYNHLYLYNLDGSLVKQLTKGNFVVKEIIGMDSKGENLFYTATDRPIDIKLYSLNLKTGNSFCITPESGKHLTAMSSDGSYLIDNYSSIKIPRKINVLTNKGKLVKEILNATNPLKGYNIGSTELFTIQSADSIDLYCRLVKPFDFDEKKKYPVLVYVYNGPHVQLITDSWLGDAALWMHFMANKGYLVFTLDGRGSDNRGKEFEQAVYRNLGEMEMRDQIEGVKYLKKLPFVDDDRFAIHGWSFGGFMATNMMLRKPDVFNVGVAGGSVTDWRMYEIMYTERYMDTPETNPDGYAKADLKNYINGLKGKLMMIHDTDDDVVVLQHAMSFLNAAIGEKKQLDYFTYPGHKHNVSGKDRIHLMTNVLNYIVENNVKNYE